MVRPHILLVDDEAPLRAVIARALEAKGYEVSGLGDAETALDRAAAEKFAAVLLDNSLPGMMGITALPRLIKLGGAPVIMITGHVTEEIRRDALLLGASALFTKPLDFDALDAALTRAISPR
jgi:DNA-binding response OmpR family regulator